MEGAPLTEAMNQLQLEEDSSCSIPISDIKDPVKFPGLWYRVHVFVYDLRTFASDPKARDRLERMVDASYLGTPYFTPAEVSALKQTEVSNGMTLEQKITATLEERLTRRMKKRVESGDFRVCAAHDLAPIFEKGFGINSNMALLNSNGLKLKHVVEWSGLTARKKKNQQKKQKKKNK